MRLAIMQGRLSLPEGASIQAFPRASWAEEFARAAAAGLDAIEWIDDRHGEGSNPIATDGGLEAIRGLVAASGVGVYSLCADWFMDYPLVRAEGAERQRRLARLAWLLPRAAAIGVERVVLPFVDASAIRTAADADAIVAALESVLADAERHAVELHLETALDPDGFAALLDRLPHPLIRVNYDTGNSAALGFDPGAELAAYGPRIGSVHVKDRVLHGGTVPLGSGSADLPRVFDALHALGYAGDIVLQVARDAPGEEVAWAAANAALVRRLWRDAARAVARPSVDFSTHAASTRNGVSSPAGGVA